MNLFKSILNEGLGFNNLKDFGKALGGDFINNLLERSIGALSNQQGYAGPSGDMVAQKAMMKAALRMMYQQGWQFAVEVDGFKDFRMFCKDITYAPVTIETMSKQIGGGNFNRPQAKTVNTVAMTVRDTSNNQIKDWFTARAKRVVNNDGTLNVPSQYLMNLTIYNLGHDGTFTVADQYKVYPSGLGDITRSLDQVTEFFSYPITFTIYSSFSGGAGGVGEMMKGAITGIGTSFVKGAISEVTNLIKF